MFCHELRHRRKAAGLTQAQLGRLTELSASAVGMLEQGRRNPSPRARARLLWALRGTEAPPPALLEQRLLDEALAGLKGDPAQ